MLLRLGIGSTDTSQYAGSNNAESRSALPSLRVKSWIDLRSDINPRQITD